MTLFGLIGTALVGLVVGAIAKLFSSGSKPSGCLVTILIGVAGAYIARWIGGEFFGWYRDGDAPGWIMSIIGAMLLLWVLRLFERRR
jgi:uncharacterized membrane protein YeaQ/YmgE (transglycosylase-associated protein family)